MSHLDPVPNAPSEAPSAIPESILGRESIHYQPLLAKYKEQIVELQSENQRLHRLVAELLIKNQQLREAN